MYHFHLFSQAQKTCTKTSILTHKTYHHLNPDNPGCILNPDNPGCIHAIDTWEIPRMCLISSLPISVVILFCLTETIENN